jgi:hypothetical protein
MIFPQSWTQEATPLFGGYDDRLQSAAISAADIDDNIHALERDFEAAMANLGSESNIDEAPPHTYEYHLHAANDTRFPSVSDRKHGELSDQACDSFDVLMNGFNDGNTEPNTFESVSRPPNLMLYSSASFGGKT